MNMTLMLREGAVDLRATVAADATVGDLVEALVADRLAPPDAVRPGTVVLVDGVAVRHDHGLAEVGCQDGMRLEIRPADATASAGATSRAAAALDHPAPCGAHTGTSTAAVHLAVVAGLDAGRWLSAAPGRHRIGQGADALLAHPTASQRHATLDVEASGRVTVTDHGSRNGTWVDGAPVTRSQHLGVGQHVRTGAVATRVVDLQPQDAPRGTGRDFNRPPRPAAPRLPDAVPVPSAGSAGTAPRPRLPLASVVGGLLMGAVMWRMTGTLAYAMLAFVTPLLAVATTVGAKRRHRSESRAGRLEQRRAMQEFAAAIVDASREATSRERAIHPDLAEVVRRATAPSIRLWERRPDHDDAFHLVVGHATRRWNPPLRRPQGGSPDPEHQGALQQHAWLRDSPVVAPGGVIGIVGDRTAALAVARGLLAQACVHHGPADLEAVLVTSDPLSWDGAKWLPHLADPVTSLPRCAGPAAARGLLADLVAARRPARDPRRVASHDEAAGPTTTLLVVLDGVEVCEGRDAPGRALLRGDAGPVLGIVLAPSVDRLPSSCDTVVVLEGVDGAARVVRPGDGEALTGVLASGISEPTLAAVGRALARHEDPEAATGRDLPTLAALPDLFADLGPAPTTGRAVAELWRRQRADGRLRAPVGMTAHGPLLVDLGADGPHALVAGTTGAGKSELLRSLVAGLAAGADPDHVAFVLVDYKGGAAFDRCADLPHVAGLVTDLDDDLAERALTCLQAELHRRETLLRAARVGDLDGYRQLAASREEPLPDLVVVIDEFATLAAELPDFLDSLVGIAQRGRSLGVHLVLATQRPSGVVSDDIRANTNLRIALRVQDRQDSTDVIEDPAAATLTRDQPGRAFVRLGPGHVVPMQSALVTGSSRGATGPVKVQPFVLRAGAGPFAAPQARGPVDRAVAVATTDLDVLVAAVNEAFADQGLRRPREPWPAPLPTTLQLADLRRSLAPLGARDTDDAGNAAADDVEGAVVAVALADEPEHQRQVASGWDLDAGSLLLVGTLGSGTSSTLRALAVAASQRWSPTALHVHAIDAGRGDLAVLADLPHVSGVVRLAQAERLARLVARLAAEVDRRRTSGWVAGGDGPRHLLLVDDWEAIASAHELGPGAGMYEDLLRVVVDGPAVGVVAAIAVGRPGGISQRLLASMSQRWVFRLPDDQDGAALGVRNVAGLPPGRCIDATAGRRQQVALVADVPAAIAELVAGRPAGEWATGGPDPIDVLPTLVQAAALPVAVAGALWELPFGVRGDSLDVATLRLHPGEHALVAGPPRSGRTTLLATLAERALAAGIDVLVAGPRTGPLDGRDGVTRIELADLSVRLTRAAAPTLVLVDDAELIEVPGLAEALAGAGPDVRLVAAVRADAARSAYGHWARAVGRSRVGVLLQPDVDLDGDLLGVRLPRRGIAPPAPGRGWFVDAGVAVQCQPATGVVPSAARSEVAA